MTNADLARKYRAQYGMEMPTLKLARIMYAKNKRAFKDLETARTALRYIEGKSGRELKKEIGSKLMAVPDRPKNPYKLPESYQEKRDPFRLPKACNNILLLSDIHAPYHDIDAISLAIEYGKKENINTIFINGDLIDFSQISKFERDWSKRSTKQEFDITEQLLIAFRNAFPDAVIYWLKGNHCIRWEKWLMQKANEVWDDPYFSLAERLKLKEKRVTLLDDKTLVKAGKLSITHGHHIFKGIFVPVSPARGAFLRAKQSVIVGHLHRASHHPEIDLDGNVISCWSTGCLCELRPNYSPLVSNSQHGFAHIIIANNGNYLVKNYQIVNGSIY